MSAPADADLAAVDDAFRRATQAVANLSDDDARAPSRLPGWTRGHVLTHLARNADGNRNMAEGAIAGEERAQYPGGAQQRDGDIEAGAERPAGELLDDLRTSQAALADTWARIPADAWELPGTSFAVGSRPVSASVGSRRRELLVHLVDLDVGVAHADLPDDFLEDEAVWLREYRTRDTWPDAPW